MTKDFFISYNSADKGWAEWIAWVLEENGTTVVIQAWDFRPGGNFVLDMQRAAQDCERTIAVLSESYLNALYTQPEWAAAFQQDPTSTERKLLPIRVAPCQPTGMMAALVYVDFVGKTEAEAEAELLRALADRAKPTTRPSFPQSVPQAERVTPATVAFPKPLDPPPPPPAPPKPLSGAALRLELFQKLARLPRPQFDQILFALNPPAGNVSPPQSPQSNRVQELLEWATSIGPGLEEIDAVYHQVVPPR